MENFLFSLNVILPLIIEMAIGFVLRMCNIIDGKTSKVMNRIVFKLFLPAMLFNNLYNAKLSSVFDPKLILFSEISVTLLVIALLILIPLIEKDNKNRGVMIQGIFRSNFAIFGIPLATSLSTDNITASASVVIASVVITFNVFAVVVLEIFRHGKPDFKKVVTGIAKNPLIISSLAGFLFMALGIKLPSAINSTVNSLSSVATPLGLIVLGSAINIQAIRTNLKQIITAVAGKLIVVPAIFIALAVLLGFRGGALAILIALFASPTAVSSYAMADEMGQNGELAGQILMITTCFCAITVFLFVLLVKQLGFI